MPHQVAVVITLPTRAEVPWGAISYVDAVDWAGALINLLVLKSQRNIDHVVYTLVRDFQHDEQGQRVLTLPPEDASTPTGVKPDAHEVGGFTD